MAKIISRHGFTIDLGKIAQGVWNMLDEDRRAPFIVGMMPVEIHEMVERLIIEKLSNEHERQHGFQPNTAAKFLTVGTGVEWVEGETFDRFVRDIMHEFYLEMLDCASRAGVLIC